MEQAVQLANDAGGMQTAEYRVQIFNTALPLAGSRDRCGRRSDEVDDARARPWIASGVRERQPIDSAAWGSARPRELLVYLMMHPEGRTKEQVGLIFWPEASSAQLRNSFHVTLHRLRKALRNPEWITRRPTIDIASTQR